MLLLRGWRWRGPLRVPRCREACAAAVHRRRARLGSLLPSAPLARLSPGVQFAGFCAAAFGFDLGGCPRRRVAPGQPCPCLVVCHVAFVEAGLVGRCLPALPGVTRGALVGHAAPRCSQCFRCFPALPGVTRGALAGRAAPWCSQRVACVVRFRLTTCFAPSVAGIASGGLAAARTARTIGGGGREGEGEREREGERKRDRGKGPLRKSCLSALRPGGGGGGG